jgi:predicted alpha/beta hydrolase
MIMTPETQVQITDLKIPAKDDFLLAAREYAPEKGASSGKVIIICPATGVTKELYDHFARFLADTGHRVIIFDYRGIGGSLADTVRNSKVCLSEWGSKDLSGVLAWAAKTYEGEGLYLVGHSMGGEIIGLASNCVRLRGIILIGCAHGYVGNWGPIARSFLIPMWYLIMPLLLFVLRYFPAKKFGLGENLPAGVAKEWVNWSCNPEFLFAAHPYAKDRIGDLRVPVLAYSFKDDFFAPAAAVKRLLDIFPNSSKQWNHVAPRDLSLRSIGRLGFFRRNLQETLWADTLNWLKGC